MKSLIAWFSKNILNYYIHVIIASFILFVISSFFATKLTLDTSLVNLLPDDYQSVKTLKKIQKQIGSFETLQILVQGTNFESIRPYSDRLANIFANDKTIKLVDYKKDINFLKKNALLLLKKQELQEIHNRLKQKIDKTNLKYNPFFINFDEDDKSNTFSLDDYRNKYKVTNKKQYYTNDKQTTLVINLYPNGNNINVTFAKIFFNHISKVIKINPSSSPDIFVEFGGNFKNKIDEYNMLIDDVKSSIIVGLSSIFLLLFAFFRKLVPPMIISLVLIFSLSLTFAVAYFLIGQLNVMTAFLFVILFGLGIDYGIHFMARFLKEYRGSNLEEAIKNTISSTGMAIKTTALTSAVAFAFFSLADFKGFSEFGIISCVGIIFAFLSYILLTPAIIILSIKLNLLKNQNKKSANSLNIVPVVNFFRCYKHYIFFTTLILSLLGVFASFHLNFLYDFSELRANLPQSLKVKEKLGEIFNQSNSPAIVLTDNKDDLLELEKYFINEKLTNSNYTVDKFKSIYTIIPDNQNSKIDIIKNIEKQINRLKSYSLNKDEQYDIDELAKLTDVKNITINDIPSSIKNIFKDKQANMNKFGYIYSNLQLRDSRNAMKFSNDIQTIQLQTKKVHASNISIVFSDLLKTIVSEGRYISLLALVGVFFLILLNIRSFKSSTLIILSLISGGLWISLIMFIFDMKFNFFNIVAIPTLIGIGVDNSIHIHYRLREEFQNRVLNLTNVFKTAGTAIIVSSFTTMLGFSGLSLANHGGLKEIGILALIGIATTLIASLLVLPSSFLIFNKQDIKEIL